MQRILIVEDDPVQLELFTTLLEHHGYQVSGARDGIDAVVCAKNHPPDLLLLDLYLPRMDGFSAASLFRDDAQLRSIPILATSAVVNEEADGRLQAAGIDRFVSKSATTRDLLAAVQALIGPADPAPDVSATG
jgi:two-component system, cell cycle response regulator DivK